MTGGLSLFAAYAGDAVPFAALDGFEAEDHFEAFQVFEGSCRAILSSKPALRQALETPPPLLAICEAALANPPRSGKEARQFFESFFTPYRVRAAAEKTAGFVTAYYEPVAEGSLTKDDGFSAPILARPDDLITLPQGESLAGAGGPFQAARQRAQELVPYFNRAEIEAGGLGAKAQPLVWLRDKAEVFFIQVQGSARVSLHGGAQQIRLVYAGRNGHPYTSIGKIFIEEQKVSPEKAGLAGLKAWIREQGQGPGEAGAELMLRNKSYIFFALSDVLDAQEGPIGGQGVSLTPFRSIALDRSIWPYGLPMWINADIPWSSPLPRPFRRLMIGQDTGSAIVGPARGDLFFGSGDAAAAQAGAIRHQAEFTVLLPRDQNGAS